MICPDCQRAQQKLCPLHARTSNHDQEVDTDMELIEARAENERLRAENTELRHVHETLNKNLRLLGQDKIADVVELSRRAARAEYEVATLRAALEKYGAHLKGCKAERILPARFAAELKCDCGFSALLTPPGRGGG